MCHRMYSSAYNKPHVEVAIALTGMHEVAVGTHIYERVAVKEWRRAFWPYYE